MAALKVLIVDDDPWILRMVTTVLEKRGHAVFSAGDGQEAYAKALEVQPDLIVTDVMMPRMDGWALVRSLRARPEFALVPVIFLTALGSDEDRIHGFRLGADDYLAKPFRFEELDLRVGNALRKRAEVVRAAELVRKEEPRKPKDTGGIHGSLKQLGLSSLLTLIEIEHKSGILVLQRGDGAVARLFAQKGRIVSAKLDSDDTRGAEAVYEVLQWSDGRFDFNALDVDMDDEINTSTTHLLMEAARRMDEGA